MALRGIRVSLDNLKRKISEFTTGDDMLRGLKEIVRLNILPSIARGISPVKGFRNFPKYKDKDKYPGDLKPSGKPNLDLSGDMLSYYTAWRVGPKGFAIGISPNAPKEKGNNVKGRALANNIGLNGIPARRFIPVESQSETFNVSIQTAYRNLFRRILKERLRKK